MRGFCLSKNMYAYFFLGAGFLAAVDLGAGFLAAVDLGAGFLAAVDLGAGFLAAVDLGAGFLAAVDLGAGFLAAGFFLVVVAAAAFCVADFALSVTDFVAELNLSVREVGFLVVVFFVPAVFVVVFFAAVFPHFAPFLSSPVPQSIPLNRSFNFPTHSLPPSLISSRIFLR
jgi:hypothetical protein